MGTGIDSELPVGVQDLLPREMDAARQLEGILENHFSASGFHEVSTPTVEFYETICAGMSREERERTYKLVDRYGRILVLRPDLTMPVARLAATKLSTWPRPLRLFYFGSVFRHSQDDTGLPHEVFQAGAEIVGEAGLVGDVKAITLALGGLRRLGLWDVRLGIGHTGFFDGLKDELSADKAHWRELTVVFKRRDMVAARRLVRDIPLSKEVKEILGEVISSPITDRLLNRAEKAVTNEKSKQAVGELKELKTLLSAQGFAGEIYLDLGLRGSFTYYTGIVFEGYLRGVGSPVITGGRYDELLAQFGKSEAACGFAYDLSAILSLENKVVLGSDPGMVASIH